MDVDLKKMFDFSGWMAAIKRQPRYVIYGSGLIALGLIFVIVGIILL